LTEIESARHVKAPFYLYFDAKLGRKMAIFAHCSSARLQIKSQQLLYRKPSAAAQNDYPQCGDCSISTHTSSPAKTLCMFLCLWQGFLIRVPWGLMASDSLALSYCCICVWCMWCIQTALGTAWIWCWPDDQLRYFNRM